MEFIGAIWTAGVTRPMINALVFLYTILASNFGLAIIAFTILTRVLLYPLTIKQLKSTKAMQALAPRQKALQERFKNDRARLQKEQMALFKEAGVSPLGCLGPLFLQLPIFIGMFYAIRDTVADTPEQLVDLSRALYAWLPGADAAIPLNTTFAGMDLGQTPQQTGGILFVLLPVLVGGTMWVVQKMTTTPGQDPSQQSMTNMMNWMFPLMFGVFTINFPNGLALYWIVTNVVSIALQYRVTGWGSLKRQPAPAAAAVGPAPASGGQPAPTAGQPAAQPVGSLFKRIFLGSGRPPASAPPQVSTTEASTGDGTPPPSAREGQADGRAGDDRQDGRRSYRQGTPSARGRPRRRRSGGRRPGS